MVAGFFYVFSLLIYGALAAGIAYITYSVFPLFTLTGSLIFSGLFFFLALFLHEVSLYRHRKFQIKLAKNTLVKEHARLGDRVETLHQKLLKFLKSYSKEDPQTFLEENLKGLKEKTSRAPEKSLQLLDLYISVLSLLIDRLEKLPLTQKNLPQEEKDHPVMRREPTLKIPAIQASSFEPVFSSSQGPRLSIPSSPPQEHEKKPSPLIKPFPSLEKNTQRHSLSPLEIASHLHEGVRQDRVDIQKNPIVSLPQRKLMLYQCLPQIRCANGWMMTYEDFQFIARQEQLSPYIDHTVLSQVVQWSKATSYRYPHLRYLCPTSLESLQSRDFLSSFLDFSHTYPQIASRILFQVSGYLFSQSRETLIPLLKKCALDGISFCVDNLVSYDQETLGALVESRVQFIILPASDILKVLHKDPKGEAFTQLHKQLESHGIEIIVNQVLDEKTILLLLDLGISYASGDAITPIENKSGGEEPKWQSIR